MSLSRIDAKKVFQVALVCLAYFLAGRAGLALSAVHHFTTVIWAPSGIALSAVVLWGYDMLPGVMLGAFLTNLSIGAFPPLALAIAAGNTAATWVGAYLLRERFQFDPMLRRLFDATALILTSIVATVLAAIVGSLSLEFFGVIHANSFADTFAVWWVGDALGVLLFAPFLMRWVFKPIFTRSRAELIEGTLLFALLVLINGLISWMHVGDIGGVAMVYILLIPLIWAALRAGPRGMTLALIITTLSSLTAAAVNGSTTPQAMFLLAIFLGVINILFLLFVSIVEERKEAVIALRAQIAKLDETIERLRVADESKSEFIATLAHELRNPLSPIISSLELMRHNGIKGENETLFKTLESHTGIIARLLEDLLDVTRITRKKFRLKKGAANLKEIIARSTETVESFYAGKKHRLEVLLPDEPVWLSADPVRLEQVIVNLLFNAGKYTPPGGHITLAVSVQKNRLIISVKDNGIGIVPEMLERIFDAFEQAPSARGTMGSGLGLGLALTKRLVELHGGSVVARSAGQGQGSEFIINLPLPSAVQLPFNLPEGERPAVAKSSNMRVLVVDDNEAAANALGALLQNGGHIVELAYTGQAALDIASQFEPEAVLLDIGLPDIDGYEVAARLRRDESRSFAIIALTGWGQDSDKVKARAAGFDHHLTKPVSIADVERTLLRVRRAREAEAARTSR